MARSIYYLSALVPETLAPEKPDQECATYGRGYYRVGSDQRAYRTPETHQQDESGGHHDQHCIHEKASRYVVEYFFHTLLIGFGARNFSLNL